MWSGESRSTKYEVRTAKCELQSAQHGRIWGGEPRSTKYKVRNAVESGAENREVRSTKCRLRRKGDERTRLHRIQQSSLISSRPAPSIIIHPFKFRPNLGLLSLSGSYKEDEESESANGRVRTAKREPLITK